MYFVERKSRCQDGGASAGGGWSVWNQFKVSHLPQLHSMISNCLLHSTQEVFLHNWCIGWPYLMQYHRWYFEIECYLQLIPITDGWSTFACRRRNLNHSTHNCVVNNRRGVGEHNPTTSVTSDNSPNWRILWWSISRERCQHYLCRSNEVYNVERHELVCHTFSKFNKFIHSICKIWHITELRPQSLVWSLDRVYLVRRETECWKRCLTITWRSLSILP